MNDAAQHAGTCEIMVDDVFPHPPETVWKALTNGDLMRRWLRMAPSTFEPVVGSRFSYQTTPAGEWEGTIRCEVLEVITNERFAYSWRGGHEGNSGYGSKLDTVVTFTLQKVEEGTRLRLVHSGFVLPTNKTAYDRMSAGWARAVPVIRAIANEQD